MAITITIAMIKTMANNGSSVVRGALGTGGGCAVSGIHSATSGRGALRTGGGSVASCRKSGTSCRSRFNL